MLWKRRNFHGFGKLLPELSIGLLFYKISAKISKSQKIEDWLRAKIVILGYNYLVFAIYIIIFLPVIVIIDIASNDAELLKRLSATNCYKEIKQLPKKKTYPIKIPTVKFDTGKKK